MPLLKIENYDRYKDEYVDEYNEEHHNELIHLRVPERINLWKPGKYLENCYHYACYVGLGIPINETKKQFPVFRYKNHFDPDFTPLYSIIGFKYQFNNKIIHFAIYLGNNMCISKAGLGKVVETSIEQVITCYETDEIIELEYSRITTNFESAFYCDN